MFDFNFIKNKKDTRKVIIKSYIIITLIISLINIYIYYSYSSKIKYIGNYYKENDRDKKASTIDEYEKRLKELKNSNSNFRLLLSKKDNFSLNDLIKLTNITGGLVSVTVQDKNIYVNGTSSGREDILSKYIKLKNEFKNKLVYIEHINIEDEINYTIILEEKEDNNEGDT